MTLMALQDAGTVRHHTIPRYPTLATAGQLAQAGLLSHTYLFPAFLTASVVGCTTSRANIKVSACMSLHLQGMLSP